MNAENLKRLVQSHPTTTDVGWRTDKATLTLMPTSASYIYGQLRPDFVELSAVMELSLPTTEGVRG